MSEIMKYVFCSVWFLSLSLTVLSLFVMLCNSFSFYRWLAVYLILVCLSIHVNGHWTFLVWCYYRRSCCEHSCINFCIVRYDTLLLGLIFRSGMAGSYAKQYLIFFKRLPNCSLKRSYHLTFSPVFYDSSPSSPS
jgi:hypothetical protein